MNKVIAFDIYGTLIDTQAVLPRLHALIGERAVEVARLWRHKQLEYSFRRGLMDDYCDFALCTRQALVFACRSHGLAIDESLIDRAMQAYADLEAFADVPAALQALREQGLPLYAFSNGSAEAVARLLDRAGIRHCFESIVSVEEVRSFKPSPQVYAHLLRRCGSAATETCLVSSNAFDVLGAAHAGLRSAWLRRESSDPFDPWEMCPDITLEHLGQLPGRLPEVFR